MNFFLKVIGSNSMIFLSKSEMESKLVIPSWIIRTLAVYEMILILLLYLRQVLKAELLSGGMVVVDRGYPNLLANLQLMQSCNQTQTS